MKYPGNKSDKEQVFLTPSSILKRYDGWFDPCPHPRPVDFNGLEMSWGEKAFVNPPWGNIRPWVEKAILESGKGCVVHMLIAAKPTTRVFHDLIFPNADVEWIRGRVPYHRVRDGQTVCLESCLVFVGPTKVVGEIAKTPRGRANSGTC